MSIELLRLYVADPNQNAFTDDQLQGILESQGGDIPSAASEGWRIKAGSVADWYRVSVDGDSLDRGAVFDHCMAMARFFALQGGGRTTSVRMVIEADDMGESEMA